MTGCMNRVSFVWFNCWILFEYESPSKFVRRCSGCIAFFVLVG